MRHAGSPRGHLCLRWLVYLVSGHRRWYVQVVWFGALIGLGQAFFVQAVGYAAAWLGLLLLRGGVATLQVLCSGGWAAWLLYGLWWAMYRHFVIDQVITIISQFSFPPSRRFRVMSVLVGSSAAADGPVVPGLGSSQVASA